MSDSDKSDEIRLESQRLHETLTERDKWWEFLDPKTYEVKEMPRPAWSQTDKLDWSKVRKTQRLRTGPVGFGFFNRCADCGESVPPDFTFCVHCGGEPQSTRPRMDYSIVIKELRDDTSREAAEELILTAGANLDPAEVRGVLTALPAVINVYARKDQTAALVAKLAERGIMAKAFSTNDPSVPWISETLESVSRNPRALVAVIVVVFGTLALTLALSWGWLIFGLLVLAGLFARQLAWFRNRYHVSLESMLELLIGLDPDTAIMCRRLLHDIRDREMRQHLTVCLMEYYSLQQQLLDHEETYGSVLFAARESLEELFAGIISVCGKFAKMDVFLHNNDPRDLSARRSELREELERATDEGVRDVLSSQLTQLDKQATQLQKMTGLREGFRERMAGLAAAMEGLRNRIQLVRTQPDETSWDDIRLETILVELDEELGVFEETVDEVEYAR